MSVFKDFPGLESLGKNSRTFKDPQEPCIFVSAEDFCDAVCVAGGAFGRPWTLIVHLIVLMHAQDKFLLHTRHFLLPF